MQEKSKIRYGIAGTGLFILGLSLLYIVCICPSAGADFAGQAELRILEPNGVGDTLAELDEFATFQIGDPWDMQEPSDLQQFRTADSLFENERFSDGIFIANASLGNGREYIMPLFAGPIDHGAMRIGRLGYNYPIDADRYRYLSFRMYSNAPVCRAGVVRWLENDTHVEAVSGVSNAFLVPPEPCETKEPGWYTYVLDLKTIGTQWGEKRWQGIVRELRIIPVGGVPVGTEIRMDWIRLTASNPTTARPYLIRWEGGIGQVQIFASRKDRILDENDIFVGTADSQQGQFVWQTGTVEAGTYHIYITDGNAGTWSSGAIVLNLPPVAEVLAPSMTSGPEYSSIEIGDSWDMSNPTDVVLSPPFFNICMDEIQFSNGLLQARTPRCPTSLPHNDPMIVLGGMDANPPGIADPEVDSQRYRYLSFRFYMAGEQNLASGWNARIFWWRMDAQDSGVLEPPSTGRDIVLHEGWNTYKLDLAASDALDETTPDDLPWLQAHPNRLRLDPNELLPQYSPGYIYLDWLRLTAMDEITSGMLYKISFSTDRSQLAYQVYYDTDKDPTNGRIPIEIQEPGTTPAGPPRVFLPIVAGSQTGPVKHQVQWDTSGVPAGQYWISVDLDDGYNTTTWYSEIPMKILPGASSK